MIRIDALVSNQHTVYPVPSFTVSVLLEMKNSTTSEFGVFTFFGGLHLISDLEHDSKGITMGKILDFSKKLK